MTWNDYKVDDDDEHKVVVDDDDDDDDDDNDDDYSQLDATRLVGYLPSHIQRALVE